MRINLEHPSIDLSKVNHGFIAIDPGEETGICYGYLTTSGEIIFDCITCEGSPAEQVLFTNTIMNKMHVLDDIVVEAFDLSTRTLVGGKAAKHTAELYFGLKVFLDMGALLGDDEAPNKVFHYRPSVVKNDITDAWMKQAGYWQVGNKQWRDATRLFLHHARMHSDVYKDIAR